MKTIVLVLMSAYARFALGGIYVWTGGGESGNWLDAANWSDSSGAAVSSSPGAGDVAEFTSSVEITSDLELAEGTLAITNAASAALHFKGVVSGRGGIMKGGDGELHLHRTNTFTGGLVSCGTGAYNENTSSSDSSCVYVYMSDALGAGEAVFDPVSIIGTSYGHGARLYIRADYTDTFVFSHPIMLSGDQASRGNIVIDDSCALITFKELVSSSFRVMPKSTSVSQTVVFEKGFQAPNYNLFEKGIFHFKGPVTGTFYPYIGSRVHLYSTENTYTTFRVSGSPCLYATNVLRQSGSRLDFVEATSVVNMNGFDQTITGMTRAFVQSTSSSTFGFTSPLGNPAVLHLEDAVPSHYDFRGLFSGSAGLVWNPADAEKEFCFSNTVQTTCGRFEVANGIMRFRDGAGFEQLGTLTVKSSARFVVEPTAGVLNVNSVAVESGGRLELAEGQVLQCSVLTVGGETYESTGYYGQDELPGTIVGKGRLLITKASNIWVGGDGDWGDAVNWSLGRVPSENESVSVNGKYSIVLSGSTPKLYSFHFAGGATLTFSNGWNVCVQADDVKIHGSTVTVAGPFTNETDKCRVHFKCGRFFMDAASEIDVDGKGWRGGGYIPEEGVANPTGKYVNPDGIELGGFGPGRANAQMGASHFGLGAPVVNDSRVYTPHVSALYDDPYAPTEPGSGGFGLTETAYSCVFDPLSIPSGGGAVFIEASGEVELHGRISACGVGSYINFSYYCNNSKFSSTGGSGGSVRIVCGSISGDGEILADGGNGGFSIPYRLYNAGGKESPVASAGGGGGVAIVYDAARQLPGAVEGMKISAAAGYYPEMPKITSGQTEFLPYAKMDKYRRDAEPGTLYFTDGKIIDDTIGRGLNGKLFSVAEYTYDGDLDWSYGNVRFGATGAVFTVNGNLTVTGGWSRVDIGGITKITNFGTRPYIHAGTVPVKLNVTGDLVVSNGAALAVYAAEVVDETSFGAEVDVGGTFVVGDGGTVLPTSDYGNGGAPGFSVGAFRLHEGGRVDADHRGYSGAWNSADYSAAQGVTERGMGPGAGNKNGAGAGHGGIGGRGEYDGASQGNGNGGVYGDAYRPVRSGSGGGSGGYTWAGDGGGVFYLVSSGAVELSGTITADGSFPEYSVADKQHNGGSGSGGSVCICGKTVTGTETVRISARGGDAPMLLSSTVSSGAGGGGRVSIWTGHDVEVSGVKPRRLRSQDPSSSVFDGTLDWAGTIDVGGGTNIFPVADSNFTPLPSCSGSAGTVWFNRSAPQSLSVIIR